MRNPTRVVLIGTGLVALGYFVGRLEPSRSGGGQPTPTTGPADPAATVWTCSMHPSVRLPRPGPCPICSMDLVPATADAGGDPEPGAPRLTLSESALALADVETARVERRSVAHEVNMVGKIALDETRVAYITSWVSGRLDRLFVDYTGVNVRADDHLVEIYSPTLYAAQQELLQAIATAKKLKGSTLDILKSTSDQTIVSAREKLRLYGIGDAQIAAIVENGVPDRHVTIHSPIGGVVVDKNAREGMYVDEGTRIYTIADLSKLWVVLDAYESDLAWLRYGQDVEFQVEAFPGETFHGRVAFIDPLLDDRTRTVRVRLNVENVGQRLKPQMFVSATAHAVLTPHGKVVDEDLAGKWMCPMHPEVVSDDAGRCFECEMDLAPAVELGFAARLDAGESLVVPHTAPLLTGKRAVVYVRVPGRERPTFEGRQIDLGPRAGDWYVVHGGLAEGEEVVVKGNFKLDAELQIRARPSMMNPGAGGASGAPSSRPAEEAPPDASEAAVTAPGPFRRELGRVVDAYLELQSALARDESGAEEARAIGARLAAVDASQLDGAERARWDAAAAGLRTAAEQLASASAVEERRSALSPLTRALVAVLDAFGFDHEDGLLGVYHCPMALGAGADWVQPVGDVRNPYLGPNMLRCGSQVRRLSPR